MHPMTEPEIESATQRISQEILGFDYLAALTMAKDDSLLKQLYKASSSRYEKLHLYRIYIDGKENSIESDVIQKFINQAFHIENDYIYQLDPGTFQTILFYVISACDAPMHS